LISSCCCAFQVCIKRPKLDKPTKENAKPHLKKLEIHYCGFRSAPIGFEALGLPRRRRTMGRVQWYPFWWYNVRCGGRRASVLQRIRGTFNWNSRSPKKEEKKKRNSAIISSGFVHKLRNKEAGEETEGADYQHVGVSSRTSHPRSTVYHLWRSTSVVHNRGGMSWNGLRWKCAWNVTC